MSNTLLYVVTGVFALIDALIVGFVLFWCLVEIGMM